MDKKHILIIEDEEDIRDLLRMNLTNKGFSVSCAESGKAGLERIDAAIPDIILLDWMLPEVSGIEILKKIRTSPRTKKVPVIMLTARSESENISQALDAGADDYVTKPFVNRELVSRINAVLRRSEQTPGGDGTLTVNSLSLNLDTHRASYGDTALEISPTEFRLLHVFMSHPDRVFSREQLLDKVWGTNVYVEERTVDVHIRRLRKTLKTRNAENLIETVHGIGYRFALEHKPA